MGWVEVVGSDWAAQAVAGWVAVVAEAVVDMQWRSFL